MVSLGVRLAQLRGVVERQPHRHVAAERVVGARLVGDEIGREPTREQVREDLRAVADEADRHGLARRTRLVDPAERLVEVVGLAVEVPSLDAALDPRRVDLDAQRDAAVHRDGERLRPAHPAQAAGERHRSSERAAEPLRRRLGERLVRALQDPLGPDVDPGARRHLPVHREPRVLELAERVPRRPLRHEHRVRDQHARRHLVRSEHTDRLAGLHEHRLVVRERPQRPHDRVERLPRTRRPAGPAVDHEILRSLGDVGVEVVHEHPHRGLLRPRPTRQLGAPRCPDLARAHARDDSAGWRTCSRCVRPAAWPHPAGRGPRRCARGAPGCRTA